MVAGPYHGFGVRQIQVLGHLLLLCLTYSTSVLLSLVGTKASNGEFILKFPDDDFTIQKFRGVLAEMTATNGLYAVAVSSVGKITGGYLALKINNKYLVIATVVGQILAFSAVIPFSLLFDIDGLTVVLIVLQFPEAFQYPLTLSVYSAWLPADELPFFLGLIYLVQPSTFLLVNIISSKISGYGSFYVFYTIPILLSAWLVAYIFGGAGSPNRCFYLTGTEKSYLAKTVLSRRPPTWGSRVPFTRLLRMNVLPMYIFLELAMESSNKAINGKIILVDKGYYVLDQRYYIWILIALPFFIYAVSKLTIFLLKSEHITKSKARKYCNTIGVWGLALCCLLTGYCGLAHNVKTVDVISKCIKPLYFMGCFASFFDVVPEYVPFVYAVSNSIAVITFTVIDTMYRTWGTEVIKMTTKSILVVNACILYLVNMWFLFATIEYENLEAKEPKGTP